MKKGFEIFLFALMLFFTSNNINKADASQFEGDAAASIKCAGAFFALTSISKKEPALGEYFQRQTELSLKIAVAKGNKTFSELHGRKMNKGEVDLYREYGVMFIDDFYTSSKKYVPQFVSDCLAWNVKVIKYSDGRTLQAVANNLDFPRQQDLAKYPHSNFEELVPHIYDAFAIWDEIGKPSPMKLKKAIETPKPKAEEEFDFLKGLEPDVSAAARMCGEKFSYDMLLAQNSQGFFSKYDAQELIKNGQFVLGFVAGSKAHESCSKAIQTNIDNEGKISQRLTDTVLYCHKIGLQYPSEKYGTCVLQKVEGMTAVNTSVYCKGTMDVSEGNKYRKVGKNNINFGISFAKNLERETWVKIMIPFEDEILIPLVNEGTYLETDVSVKAKVNEFFVEAWKSDGSYDQNGSSVSGAYHSFLYDKIGKLASFSVQRWDRQKELEINNYTWKISEASCQ